MLLAVDVGNTNITFGFFQGKLLKKQFDIPTQKYNKKILTKKIKGVSSLFSSVICSVVPNLTKNLQQDLKLLGGRKPYIIGRDLKVPLKNRYRLPKQVGQDRLVSAYAASYIYGYPAIIVDSGTAITLDVVSKNNAYLGGLIFPGLEMSLSALHEKTALLPQVKLTLPKALIGRDTQNSILSGVVFGTATLIYALSLKIGKLLGKNTQIIGTGGSIALIKRYLPTGIIIDQRLTLKGINLIYEHEIKNRF